MIIVESKRKKPATILRQYPDAVLADVTSGAKDDLVKLSPFYPHGGIPVPFGDGYTATCVESIWQGLKVFEAADVDTSLFLNDTMKGLKRTVRRYGKPLGHRKGVNEKCARIRGAFVGQFDDHMARHYYIDGLRGEAKRISLPRNLVVWEAL